MRVRIETERLVLRNLIPDDYESAFEWCGNPNVNRFLMYPLYKNAEDVKAWIERKNNDDPDNYDIGFTLKETGELIGCGGLIYKADEDVWSLGYNIKEKYWGNGYVPEAINGIIDEISKTRKIHIMEGVFAKENIKSQRVMEKLGMSFYEETSYDKMDGTEHFEAMKYRKYF